MTFGKLVEGMLHLCPLRGADGQGRLHTNLPKYYETAADRDGWMEVVYTERPEGDYEPYYIVENLKIVQYWRETEPAPDPYDSRLDMIEECILEMSEIIYA